MKLRDAKLLFDISIRLQIFAEGVKATEARLYDAVLLDIEDEFRKLLSRVNYDTLDKLTKKELNALVASLRKVQLQAYGAHIDKMLKRLEAFMQASLKVKRIAWVWATKQLDTEEDEPDAELPTDEEASDYILAFARRNGLSALFGLAAITAGAVSLWPKVLAEPIAGIGALPKPYLNAWAASATVGLENTLRKGYSNALTPSQTIAEASKLLNRVKAQAVAVSGTTMQHIASVVSASIASGMYGKYQWLSVIDGHTTDICLSRNGRIYDYGQGPLPPAHTLCRSSITPITRGAGAPPETFYSFMRRQPEDIQDFALGEDVAKKLRSEKLKAKDLTKLTDPTPMSITEFSNSAKRIVGK